MKLKSQPAPQPTNTVDDLRAQLDSIAAALSLETDRDKQEKAAAAEAARVDREAAQLARRQTAVKKARTATVAAVNVIAHLDAGVFAELDLAAIELQRAGAYPTGPTATIATLRQQVTLALSRIKAIDPELLGLPPHPTAQEIAIHDARSRLAAAEKRLADLSESTTRGSRWQDLVTEAEARVKTCQAKVTDLTGESFALANLGAKIKIANLARYIDPPQANPSEVVT